PTPLGGTSYAANAQVFAPLSDESVSGGTMVAAGTTNWCDRGSAISRIGDGSSNTILMIHSYALCGQSLQTGTAWGYTAGVNAAPSTTLAFQPWQPASLLGQASNNKSLIP